MSKDKLSTIMVSFLFLALILFYIGAMGRTEGMPIPMWSWYFLFGSVASAMIGAVVAYSIRPSED